MTANQIYKKLGAKIPFSEWIGEQKTKYGDKFIENEAFLNMAGVANFVGNNQPKDPAQVVFENADENIQYESKVVPNTVSNGSSTPVKAGLFGGGTMRTFLIVAGVAVVGYYLWNMKCYKKLK